MMGTSSDVAHGVHSNVLFLKQYISVFTLVVLFIRTEVV